MAICKVPVSAANDVQCFSANYLNILVFHVYIIKLILNSPNRNIYWDICLHYIEIIILIAYGNKSSKFNRFACTLVTV